MATSGGPARYSRKSDPMRRPIYGRCSSSQARAQLSALLMVALHNLMFGGEPIFGLTASAGFALLIKFIGAAPDFVLDVDGNHILARLCLSDFESPRFRRDLKFWLDLAGHRFGYDCIHIRNADGIVGPGWLFTRTIKLATRVRLCSRHIRILLTY